MCGEWIGVCRSIQHVKLNNTEQEFESLGSHVRAVHDDDRHARTSDWRSS